MAGELHQERIDVDDLPGVSLQNQDAVLGGFEQAAVTFLGCFQGALCPFVAA
jgi:hypothetical protein